MITQKRLKELVKYKKKKGTFKWRSYRTGQTKTFGYDHRGYLRVRIEGKQYLAHRLAWLYIYGEFPINDLDHINHDKRDNRIKNLREVSHCENSRNQSLAKNNTSGVIGVNFKKSSKRWQSSIRVDGKLLHLGYFTEFHEAANARKNAEILYGFHENHGN